MVAGVRSLLVCLLASLTSTRQVLADSSRGVTHEEIRDAILSMAHMFRDLTDKLERHEMRERTLGDQLKRALSTLDKRERAQDSKIDTLVAGVKGLEQRLDKIQAQATEGLREKDVYTVETGNLQTWMTNIEDKLSHRESGGLAKSLEGLPLRMEALEREVKETGDRVIRGTANMTEEAKGIVLRGLAEERERAVREVEERGVEIMGRLKEETEEAARRVGVAVATLDETTRAVAEDVKALPRVEQVMIQTADNVMDTKRRVEYGVHQMVLEVSELVKGLGKDLDDKVTARFDEISKSILENQDKGLTDLSGKVEKEIGQVWRQIGIMYKQLSASAGTLDSLQKQTETYVNGSLSTMDGMESKVTLITGRMNEVDENLNYLLGRLSLVTQEFNLTKGALAHALDNIRASFKHVKSHVDPGPGPNDIPSDETSENQV